MRTLAIALLLINSGALTAENKKPTGSWSKKVEGHELKFAFQKGDIMVFTMSNGTDGCEMHSKFTYDNNVVKCEVTKFEKKGNFPVEKEKGYQFSFKFEIKDTKAKISNCEGKDIDDQAKALLEGDYEKATD